MAASSMAPGHLVLYTYTERVLQIKMKKASSTKNFHRAESFVHCKLGYPLN